MCHDGLAGGGLLLRGPNARASGVCPGGTPAVDKGDNAWMLTSSALVLMMTGPGLALFYCGLVRKKNVLSVMMQCVFLMCLLSVIWAIYGYSLSFGGEGLDRRLPLSADEQRRGDLGPGQRAAGPLLPVRSEHRPAFPCSPTCSSRGCSLSSRRR